MTCLSSSWSIKVCAAESFVTFAEVGYVCNDNLLQSGGQSNTLQIIPKNYFHIWLLDEEIKYWKIDQCFCSLHFVHFLSHWRKQQEGVETKHSPQWRKLITWNTAQLVSKIASPVSCSKASHYLSMKCFKVFYCLFCTESFDQWPVILIGCCCDVLRCDFNNQRGNQISTQMSNSISLHCCIARF